MLVSFYKNTEHNTSHAKNLTLKSNNKTVFFRCNSHCCILLQGDIRKSISSQCDIILPGKSYNAIGQKLISQINFDSACFDTIRTLFLISLILNKSKLLSFTAMLLKGTILAARCYITQC